MRKGTIIRTIGFIGSAGITVALVGAAATGTGAYFTDSKSGTIAGTMATVKIHTGGGTGADNLNFAFDKMLPGQAQTQTVTFQNTGNSSADIWVVFDKTDLGNNPTPGGGTTSASGLNSWGTYAEVHLATSGTEIFGSANLNDGYPCGTPGTRVDAWGVTDPTLCYLAGQYKLASNVGPTASGDMTFSFTPSKKFQNTAQGLPVLSLGYKIVATQVGIAPDNPYNTPP
jgi:hypothetical protein